MNIFQKLVDGANKASDYAQQSMKITKINTRITDNKREIEKNCNELGNVIYETYKVDDISWMDAKIRSLFLANLELERENVGLELDVNKIKNEKECECGKKVAEDAKFCPSCGKKLYEDPEEMNPVVNQEIEIIPKECRNCFVQIEPDARFCDQCGSAQRV